MQSQLNVQPLFDLGQIVATPGFLRAIGISSDNPAKFLVRHATGDWGELDAEDKQANDEAIFAMTRLLSAYRLSDGTRFWIITEADRSVTTFLLPQEY